MTQQYKIPYLDVHAAFQREVPIYRICYKGNPNTIPHILTYPHLKSYLYSCHVCLLQSDCVIDDPPPISTLFPYTPLTFEPLFLCTKTIFVGCVTRDGEHPSSHGTDIMAKMFSQVGVRVTLLFFINYIPPLFTPRYPLDLYLLPHILPVQIHTLSFVIQ